jgi:protein-S-isoprenylcysteine O-methyltransferase Ste14
VNANNPALRWGNDLIIKTGRWPLQIFSMGAILSVIVTVFFSTYSLSLPEKLAFNFAVIFLTALAAVALSNYAKLTTSMNIAPNSAKTAGLPSGSRS